MRLMVVFLILSFGIVSYAAVAPPEPVGDAVEILSDLDSALLAPLGGGSAVLGAVENGSLRLRLLGGSGGLGDPFTVGSNLAPDIVPALAGADGVAVAAWSRISELGIGSEAVQLSWRSANLGETAAAEQAAVKAGREIVAIALTVADDGRCMLVWTEGVRNTGGFIGPTFGAVDLRARAFSPGVALGDSVLLAELPSGALEPRAILAAAPDSGEYSVVWREFTGGADPYRLQRIDRDGNQLGLPTSFGEGQNTNEPTGIVRIPGGETVVAFSTRASAVGVFLGGISQQVFSATGVPSGALRTLVVSRAGVEFLNPMLLPGEGDAFQLVWAQSTDFDLFGGVGPQLKPVEYFIADVPMPGFRATRRAGVGVADSQLDFAVAPAHGGGLHVALAGTSVRTWSGYDEGLPATSLTRINANEIGDHREPVAAPLPDGGALVAWFQYDDPECLLSPANAISLRRIGADGTPAAPETDISEGGIAGNYGLQLSTNSAGEAAVVWVRARTAPSGTYARFIDASGTPTSPVVRVSDEDENDDGTVAVARLEGGGAVVAIHTGTKIRLSGYTSTGVLSTGAVIDTLDVDRIVALPTAGGGCFVCWNETVGNFEGLAFQAYDSALLPVGVRGNINSDVSFSERSLKAITLDDGSHRVLWEDQGRLVQAMLNPAGSLRAELIGGSAAIPREFSAARIAGGRFVIVEEPDNGDSDSPNDETLVAVFDETGAAVVDPFFVAQDIGFLPIGSLALPFASGVQAVFQAETRDGSNIPGLFAQMIDITPDIARVATGEATRLEAGFGTQDPQLAGLSSGRVAAVWANGDVLRAGIPGDSDTYRNVLGSIDFDSLFALLPSAQERALACYVEDGNIRYRPIDFGIGAGNSFSVETVATGLSGDVSAFGTSGPGGVGVVVWEAAGIVSAQRITAGGERDGTAFEVFTAGESPTAVFALDGSLAIAAITEVAGRPAIVAQRYNRFGVPIAGGVEVLSFLSDDASQTYGSFALAADDTGRMLLAFESGGRLFIRPLAKDLTPLGSDEFDVFGFPAVENMRMFASRGTFVLAYGSSARFYNASGRELLPDEIDLAAGVAGTGSDLVAGFSSFGNGVFAWKQTGGVDGIYFRSSIAPGASRTGLFAAYAASLGISEDPLADPDGDGANSAYEFFTGSDASSAVSRPAATGIVRNGDSYDLSQPGFRAGIDPVKRVSFEVSTDLEFWASPGEPDPVITPDGSVQFTIDLPETERRYFRMNFNLRIGD